MDACARCRQNLVVARGDQRHHGQIGRQTIVSHAQLQRDWVERPAPIRSPNWVRMLAGVGFALVMLLNSISAIGVRKSRLPITEDGLLGPERQFADLWRTASRRAGAGSDLFFYQLIDVSCLQFGEHCVGVARHPAGAEFATAATPAANRGIAEEYESPFVLVPRG